MIYSLWILFEFFCTLEINLHNFFVYPAMLFHLKYYFMAKQIFSYFLRKLSTINPTSGLSKSRYSFIHSHIIILMKLQGCNFANLMGALIITFNLLQTAKIWFLTLFNHTKIEYRTIEEHISGVLKIMFGNFLQSE